MKKLAAIASLSSYPMEGMSLSLLADDRFFLHASKLWSDAESEADWVGSLPECVYSTPTALVGDTEWSSSRARSDVHSVVRTSMSYTFREAYAELKTLPLSATQGSIAEHVATIAALSYPPATMLGQ